MYRLITILQWHIVDSLIVHRVVQSYVYKYLQYQYIDFIIKYGSTYLIAGINKEMYGFHKNAPR